MTLLDPYPGESLGLYDAADVTGAPDFDLLGDIFFRDGSNTIAAGDEWLAWYQTDWNWADRYLTDPGADVVVSWVVEVLSGTGTLVASEGFDASYNDPAVTTGTALGTVTVTGAGTYVIASALMGAAEFVDVGATIAGSFALRLECTSGSVVVQQVKVRAWPPGGALGGWVDMPGWETEPETPTYYAEELSSASLADEAGNAGTYAASWDLAAAAIVGGAPLGTLTHSFTSGNATMNAQGYAQQFLNSVDPIEIGTAHQVTSGAVVIEGTAWEGQNPLAPDLVEGVDWIRPPTEIPGDNAVLFQITGTGSTLWTDAEVTYTTSTAGKTPMGSITLETFAADGLTVTPTGGGHYTIDLTFGGGIGLVGSGTDALPTGGRFIVVDISHDFVQTANAYPGTTGGALGGPIYGADGTAAATAMTYALMPTYQVWGAGTVVQHPLRLMQRGDGLGMGSGRVLGAGTRQNSIRVFGSL